MNILIGIKQTPAKSGPPEVDVFYCGRDGAAFRQAHAELVKDNSDSKFFQIQNPLLTPLQNVVHSTEEHPDIVAAQERRKNLAKTAVAKQKKTAAQPALIANEFTREELATKDKGDLFAITDSLIEAGRIEKPEKTTKEALIAAILNAKPVPAVTV